MKKTSNITEPYIILYMHPKGFIGVYVFIILGFIFYMGFCLWGYLRYHDIMWLGLLAICLLPIAIFIFLILMVACYKIIITKESIYQQVMFGKNKVKLLCAITDVKRIYIAQFGSFDTTITAMGIDKENPSDNSEIQLFFINYERKVLRSMRPFFSPKLFEDLEDKM